MTVHNAIVRQPNTMRRPMRILIGSAHPYLPQIHGGAQSSTHELVLALRSKGHEVAVLAGLTGHGRTGIWARLKLKLGRGGFVHDQRMGYPVYRAWFAATAAAEVVRIYRPDVVLFKSGRPVQMAQAVKPTGVPMVIYFRNVETDDLGGALCELDNVRFIANSKFTAKTFAASDNVSCDVIYPLIQADRYRTQTSRENVTFINPHPYKGVDIALAIARACPEIPFVFVRAWTLSAEDESHLQNRLSTLPNVIMRPATDDMRTVYSKARIILAPSRWNEAFGRIAAEAHVNGIPVVASDRGGLPEAVGPGGLVLPPDGPIEDWVKAVSSLWHDRDLYVRLSEAAFTHSRRKEMNADAQVEALADILAACV